MGEKGLRALEKLPPGYYIPAPGTPVPGTELATPHGQLEGTPGFGQVQPGSAYPTGRPGHAIHWDDDRGAWRPAGFEPSTDPDRIFNPVTGQNGVWDAGRQEWIDTATGNALPYSE